MKKELEARPLLLLAIGLIAGLVARNHLPSLAIPLALVVLLPQWPPRAWLLGGVSLGILLSPPEVTPVVSRTFVDCGAVVAGTPKLYEDRTTVPIASGEDLYLMQTSPDADLARGDRIHVRGVVRPLSESSERHLLSQGIVGRIRASYLRVERHGFRPYRWAEAIRRSFLRFTDRTLPKPIAAAVDALCFNVDTYLDRDAKDDLRKTGTIHIVSASGLHVMVLAGALMALLSLLPAPRGAQILLLTAFLALYACATGLQGPIVRASMVAMAGLSAYLVRRDPDPLSALALAATAVLLANPREVYDVGFQLSFITVGAFVLFLPRSEERPATASWLRASLVASAASAPLVGYTFGSIPLLSIPANALVAMVVPAIVVLGMGAFGASFIWASLAQGLMLAVAPMVGWLYIAVELCARPSFSVLYVPEFSGYWLVPVYGAFLLVWRRREIQAGR
ncbi:MAG TPA: ComEC/Rec2 family competence protein [Fimbriimonas sp.]